MHRPWSPAFDYDYPDYPIHLPNLSSPSSFSVSRPTSDASQLHPSATTHALREWTARDLDLDRPGLQQHEKPLVAAHIFHEWTLPAELDELSDDFLGDLQVLGDFSEAPARSDTSSVPSVPAELESSVIPDHALQSGRHFHTEVANGLHTLRDCLQQVESWHWHGDFDTHCRIVPHSPRAPVYHLAGEIDRVRASLHTLDLERQKNYVIGSIQHDRPMSSHAPKPPFSAPSSFDDDYDDDDDDTDLVAEAVLQALFLHARVSSLLGLWSARVTVLTLGPAFMETLEDSCADLDAAWQALPGLSPRAFETTRARLEDRAVRLDDMMSAMLDALTQQSETLPDRWLQGVEDVESGVASWVAAAEKRVYEKRSRLFKRISFYQAQRADVLHKQSQDSLRSGSDRLATLPISASTSTATPYDGLMKAPTMHSPVDLGSCKQDYPELVFDFPWAIKQPSLHSSQSSRSRPSRTGTGEDSVASLMQVTFVETPLSGYGNPGKPPRRSSLPGDQLPLAAEPPMAGVQASAMQLRRPRSREMYPWRAAAPSHQPREVTSPSVQRPEWLDFSSFSLPEDEPVVSTGPSSPDPRVDFSHTSQHTRISKSQDLYGTHHARSADCDLSSLPGLSTHTSIRPARSLSAKYVQYSARDNEDNRYAMRNTMHFKQASFTSIESVDRSEVRSIDIKRSMSSMAHPHLRRRKTTHALRPSHALPKSVSLPAVPTVTSQTSEMKRQAPSRARDHDDRVDWVMPRILTDGPPRPARPAQVASVERALRTAKSSSALPRWCIAETPSSYATEHHSPPRPDTTNAPSPYAHTTPVPLPLHYLTHAPRMLATPLVRPHKRASAGMAGSDLYTSGSSSSGPGQGTWFDDSGAWPLPQGDGLEVTAPKLDEEDEKHRGLETETEPEPDEYKPENISRERRAWLAAMVTLAKQRRKEREVEAEHEVPPGVEEEIEVETEMRGRRARRVG